MRKALLLLVVLAGFLTSCDKNEEEVDPALMGYDYYPLEIGDYRIYNVTDIRFQHDVGDTTRFQLMERVDTTFYDQTDKLSYKIIRSVRPDENSLWVEDSVFVASNQNNMLMLTKDNTKYVKLVFPVKEGVKWARDAYNDRIIADDEINYITINHINKEPYIYTKVGDIFPLNGQLYSNTVTVVQGNPQNDVVELDDRKEVYARGVGLVYRLFNRADYAPCGDGQCEFGEGFKLDGHERHEELVAYGKE